MICHPKTLENKSDQKKQGTCTAIKLEYIMADEQITNVLKDMNLEDLIPRFLQESITLDIINKLSIDDFRKLGLVNRTDIMRLREKCTVYWSYCPRKLLEMVHLNLI